MFSGRDKGSARAGLLVPDPGHTLATLTTRHNLLFGGHLPGRRRRFHGAPVRPQACAGYPEEVQMRYKFTFIAGFAVGFVAGAGPAGSATTSS